MRIFNCLLVLSLLLALASCSGSSLSPLKAGADQLQPAGGVLTAVDGVAQLNPPVIPETAQDKAGWQQLETNPGRPGVDYATQRIMVTFAANASLPQGWSAASPFALSSAAAQADPQLCPYTQFVPLAAAVADRFGLKLDVQIFNGPILMASYIVPDSLSTQTVLSDLRSQGQGLIAHAVFEPLRHANYMPNDPDYSNGNDAGTGFSPQWGHHRVKATAAWDYTKGSPSVMVAVVDTGVFLTHEELAGQALVPSVAFPGQKVNFSGVGATDSVTDNVGHGTYCAGIIGAKQDDGIKITGLAPGCKILPIKITDDGTAADSWISGGVLKADSLGAQVINLSFGGPSADPVLSNMVNTVKSHGRFLAIAAGNDGHTANDYPGFYSDICVGATGDNSANPDVIANYSNYGTYVDIAAPGTFMKSCLNTGVNQYSAAPDYESGTSFACPMVAAGAALLLSYDPTMTRADLVTALETTGDPTAAFGGHAFAANVKRMNLASAFATVAKLKIRAPQLDQIVYSGVVSLTCPVVSKATSVTCSLNGNVVGTKTAAPWTFDVDTSSITFGKAVVTFVASDGTNTDTAQVEFIADNSTSTYPLAEDFTQGAARVFDGVDVKGYSATFLSAIKSQPAAEWTADSVAAAGTGSWNLPVAGGFAGQGAYLGSGGNTYDNEEIDCLVSRKVNLAGISNPSLVFQQHYNIEDGGSKLDKARVLVTTDGGKTFTAAKLQGSGNPAVWSGLQTNYILTGVDLSAFTGQTVNVLLVFESNNSGIGADTGQAKGWWVDSLILSRNYSTSVPTVNGVTVSKASLPNGLPQVNAAPVVGKALNITDFDVSVSGPQQVSRVLYWLDLAPFGTLGLEDKTVQATTGATFPANLVLPNKKNQLAILRVQYFDSNSNPGPEIDKNVYLFTLRGDTNADGTVNQADLDLYAGKLGLPSTNPGYSVFLDTDLDGQITEADASGVGYNWGKSS